MWRWVLASTNFQIIKGLAAVVMAEIRTPSVSLRGRLERDVSI